MRRAGIPSRGTPLPVPGEHGEVALLRLLRRTRDALAAVAATRRPSAGDVSLDALGPAEAAGIVRVEAGGLVRSTHPLFGSALYSSLPEAMRRGLHRELAGRGRGWNSGAGIWC